MAKRLTVSDAEAKRRQEAYKEALEAQPVEMSTDDHLRVLYKSIAALEKRVQELEHPFTEYIKRCQEETCQGEE